MKMMKKTVKATLALILLCSAVFAQTGTLADAKKAIDAEQYAKAKGILKNLIKAKPAEPENYFYLGNIYLKDDYIDSAKTEFTKGITADAEFALNHVGLGTIDLLNNDKVAAKAKFVKAQDLVKKKDNGPALYTGRAYIMAKDYDMALYFLENPANPKAGQQVNSRSAQAIDPKDAEVLISIGDAYRDRADASKGDPTNAFVAYQAAGAMNPGLVRPKLEQAIIAKRSFAWNQAIDDFNALLKINPNYAPAYRELAETYILWARADPAKDYDAHVQLAVQNYEKYMSLTDKSLESRIRHADFLVYAKRWKELQTEADAMSKESGADARVLRYKGLSAFHNKDYKTSEQAFDQWIAKADPKRIYPEIDYLYRGQAKVNVGIGPPADMAKIQQGLEDLKKAVAADSTVTDDVAAVGTSLFSAKIFDLAADASEIATKNPSLGKRVLAYYYVGLGNYYHFLTKYASDTTANRDLGKPYLAKADTAFGSVLKDSPTTLDALLHRAKIAKLLDDPKKPTGSFIPAWEKYISVITAKTEPLEAKEKANLIEGHRTIAIFHFQKLDAIKNDPAIPIEKKLEDLATVEGYVNKVLAIDPNDDYSKRIMEFLGQTKGLWTAAQAAAAKAAPGAAGTATP